MNGVVNQTPAPYHISVISPSDLFDHHADYQPDQAIDDLLKSVPAKWVVYLFTDANDQPVQLLCVKNLRASLKRRLGGEEIIGPTRKLDYRDLIRRVYWRRVDSALEADLVYLEIARQIFPQSYRGMLGFDPAWFVQVNPDNQFPRYVKTIDLTRPGILIGPLADKHAAARFRELIEDAFDLCRYYNILIESPNGRACAYKEMGKCPAPCDGTISIEQYRELIRWSAQTVVAPEKFIADNIRRMEAAAAELNFEAAAKIKQYLAQITQFGKGAFRYTRRIEDFRYLSLQHGPRSGTAKIFLITPGTVEEIAGLIEEPRVLANLLRIILRRAANLPADLTEQGAQRIGVVTDHLFRARKSTGVYLPLDQLEERALAKAYRDLQKQNTPEESDDEGVVKELQQI
jgi:excinuclease UvrABC nuclease subunit